jgi:exopolyphosphatase/guanosine-5'-triphosphate,3'-diphosphate pyrophosphatase
MVSARDEARLIYLGVRHAMDFAGGPHLIIDIGGGSVELIVADDKEPLLLESRKIGAARMTAMFIQSDPPKKREIEQLLQHYRVELTPLLQQIRDLKPVRVVGTSGTLENLAVMCSGEDDAAKAEIERDALDELVERLIRTEAADRVRIRGLDEKRQDQIIAGAILVQFIMAELGVKRIVLCGSALREGILLEYIGRHLPDLEIRRKVPDQRRRSVLDLARKCEWNETHSLQVAAIALKLFDQLEPLHELDGKARELLEYAALLHDIGWHIAPSKHHKHSMYLVQNGGLKGFSDREIEIIANMTRYHRASMPKPSHDPYMALSGDDRWLVDVGGALLRIADGLDRSHSRVVRDLRCKIGKRRVKVTIVGRGDVQLELWAARRKTDLFARVFERAVSFKAKK